jgi:hypothetical protein
MYHYQAVPAPVAHRAFGLRALGVAKQSLRAQPIGSVIGTAVATLFGAAISPAKNLRRSQALTGLCPRKPSALRPAGNVKTDWDRRGKT